MLCNKCKQDLSLDHYYLDRHLKVIKPCMMCRKVSSTSAKEIARLEQIDTALSDLFHRLSLKDRKRMIELQDSRRAVGLPKLMAQQLIDLGLTPN